MAKLSSTFLKAPKSLQVGSTVWEIAMVSDCSIQIHGLIPYFCPWISFYYQLLFFLKRILILCTYNPYLFALQWLSRILTALQKGTTISNRFSFCFYDARYFILSGDGVLSIPQGIQTNHPESLISQSTNIRCQSVKFIFMLNTHYCRQNLSALRALLYGTLH